MATVNTDLTTESGTTLLNVLPKDAPFVFSAYMPSHMAMLVIASRA
jgi:hypothetical protein